MKKTVITEQQIEDYSNATFPRTTEGGEYWTVTRLTLIDEAESVQIERAREVTVYATEREARERCAKLMIDGRDGDSALKAVYYVTCKRVEVA